MSSAPLILYLNFIPGDPVDEMLHAGIRRYALIRGWEVEALGETASRQGRISAMVSKKHPVGCIVQCGRDAATPQLRAFGGVPAVYIGADAASRSGRVSCVAFDEEAVARAAFRELSSGKPDASATVIFRKPRAWSLAREAAFRALADAAGRPCLSFRGHWPKNEQPAVRAARFAKWLAALPRRCAVFAVNDDSAIEIVSAARIVGRRIPQDLTLLGVDNDTSICEASHPTISSIQMDFENVGFLAAKLLAAKMDGRALHKMKGAACAANDGGNSFAFAPTAHTSFGGEVDTLDSREARTSLQRSDGSVVSIGPLLAVWRESTRGRGRREPRILEAVDIIRRKACDGLTARALINMFPGSRRLFELRFREATGHSVLDEIRHVRLQKAYALLAGTDTPIGAIPDFCGYDCASTLDKLFRAREHMSMQEWRRRHRP